MFYIFTTSKNVANRVIEGTQLVHYKQLFDMYSHLEWYKVVSVEVELNINIFIFNHSIIK
jgi:hypothetical protein